VDLRRNGVVRFQNRRWEILVVESEGGVSAYSGICPHLAGPLLEGEIRDGHVVCPWHRYAYDLESGECRTIPGKPWSRCEGVTRPDRPMPLRLRRLRVEVVGDRIRILAGRSE
jgi:nitrite reductase/ring-hydroxylating ferredoxin subunit